MFDQKRQCIKKINKNVLSIYTLDIGRIITRTTTILNCKFKSFKSIFQC